MTLDDRADTKGTPYFKSPTERTMKTNVEHVLCLQGYLKRSRSSFENVIQIKNTDTAHVESCFRM